MEENRNWNQITPRNRIFLVVEWRIFLMYCCRCVCVCLWVLIFLFVDVIAFFRSPSNGSIEMVLYSLPIFHFFLKPDKNSNQSANKCKFNFYTLVSIKRWEQKKQQIAWCVHLGFQQTNTVFFSIFFLEWKKTSKMHLKRGRNRKREKSQRT